MHALTLRVDAAAVEAVGDALVEAHDALSVSIEDADAGSATEQPVFDEPGLAATNVWRMARVGALFGDEAQARRAALALAASPLGRSLEVLEIAVLDDCDWVRRTQAQFGPIEISAGFWIVPTWSPLPENARRVIRLDPGLAFGTGSHPTTRMCLRWIAGASARGAAGWRRALDYGCGSGILAIALALHGAASVEAVDIDPDALAAADANAAANSVAVRSGPVDRVRPPYDLIVANILATPLKLLAPLLANLLAADGTLLLSGILARQADELAAAYAPWLTLSIADRDDGWLLLAGKRSSTSRVA